MTAPIAIQLYSLRDIWSGGRFADVIHQVADMGFLGVETFGGVPTTEAVPLFRDLRLEVVAAHSDLPLGENRNAVLDTMAALNCKRVVCPWMPPEEFHSRDSIKRVCDKLNEADAVCRDNGLTLLYHNHWFEPQPVEGKPAYQIMQEYLNPTVLFEIDTYWVKVGGLDPAAVVRELGSRAPLLHIKDGPGDRNEAMVAVGEGYMDWSSLFTAAEGTMEWAIVELDRCDTDMLQAVRQSYTYLTGKGFARGR
ncbi:MAG: sugar phosphate isomerase/epimerase [Chloroflexi bacterium]|nr:sugar phosphate isomerase/epimerase [Chloroflexota bacterium]